MGSWLLGEDQRLAAMEAIRQGRYLTNAELKAYEKKVGRVEVAGLVSTCPEDSLAWTMAKSEKDGLTPVLDSLGELLSHIIVLIVMQRHPSYTSPRLATISVIRRNSSSCMVLSQSMGPVIRCSAPSFNSLSLLGIPNSSLRLYNPTITLPPMRLGGIRWSGRRRRRTSFFGVDHLPVTVMQKVRTEIGGEVTDLDCISWFKMMLERERYMSSEGRAGRGRLGMLAD